MFLLPVARRFLSHVDRIDGPVSGGFSNAVLYRVQAGPRQFAMRGLPVNELPMERLMELHRWLKFLQDQQLPVAVPQPDSAGQTVLLEHDCYWQCEPWLPGEPVEFDQVSVMQLREMMKTLARLHYNSSRYVSTRSGLEWFYTGRGTSSSIEQRVNLIQAWTSDRLFRASQQLTSLPENAAQLAARMIQLFTRFAPMLHIELESLRQTEWPLKPCWRDLWRAHVLFQGDQLTGLIDATQARTDHVAADLSRLLGTLYSQTSSSANDALSIYEELHPLSPRERSLVQTLDRSGTLLGGMFWINRWLHGDRKASTDLHVLERVERILDRVTALFH